MKSPDMRYDRRVDPEFLKVFGSRGQLRGLTELARRARYPVDLQFRANPWTGAQHASLYVGLSTVLDVLWDKSKQRIRLSAHATFVSNAPFNTAWSAWIDASSLHMWSEQIESYLDVIIPFAAGGRAAREGHVQSAVSGFASSKRALIDREVMIHFRNQDTREEIMRAAYTDIVRAIATANIPGKKPGKFGGKCDLLGIDAAGRVLAIEVKPRNVSSIAWAPAQAIVYARLLKRWIMIDPSAAEVLNGMIQQRRDVGLLAQSARVPAVPEVVPILAIQRGANPVYLDRMKVVQQHLADVGVPEAFELETYEVSLAGQLRPYESS